MSWKFSEEMISEGLNLLLLHKNLMLLHTIYLIIGLVLLIKGADWLVSGASALAKKFHVSDLAIGLTVVAFGTSAPELVVNVIASSKSHFEIVFGNVIGSNIANLFLILGLTGIIYPLSVQSSTIWREIPLSLLAVLLLYLLANNFYMAGSGNISRVDALLLLLFFSYFLYYVFTQLKRDPAHNELVVENIPPLKMYIYIFTGLAGLVWGGRMVVNNAIEIASFLGISEKIIGLTIIAIGTSLPELATSIVAALRKNTGIAVGNIIGSNIFNIVLIIPLSALMKPLSYNKIFNMDLYLLAGGTIFLFASMFLGRHKKLDRWEAYILFFTYLAYTSWLVINEFSA